MKRVLRLIFYIIIPVLSLHASTNCVTLSETQQSASQGWIEVGKVIGVAYITSRDREWYRNGSDEMTLYVMYIGDKLIYRVEWGGAFYPVSYDDYMSKNAKAYIPDWLCTMKMKEDGTYYKVTKESAVYFNVPTW